jgi:FkbM family methyltransferase
MSFATSLLKNIISLASTNWPFANGSGRLIDKFGRGIDLGSQIRTARTSDGFVIDVYSDDLIGRHILLSGKFDRSPIQLLLDFAEPGDHVIDIGANIGYVSCLMLHRIPGSILTAVEPQEAVLKLLKNNLKRFQSERYRLIEAGLSDSNGEGAMMLDAANKGASRLVEKGTEGVVTIPLVSARQVFDSLPRLDLIKMDIEGHEETVFRSALEAIRRLQPKAILFEDQTGEAAANGKIGRQLASAGYKVFGIGKKLLSTNLSPITAENVKQFNDFMAVSATRPLPAAARRRCRGLV